MSANSTQVGALSVAITLAASVALGADELAPLLIAGKRLEPDRARPAPTRIDRGISLLGRRAIERTWFCGWSRRRTPTRTMGFLPPVGGSAAT